MKWGFFGPVHIATLIFAAAMIMGLYLILRNRSQKVQMLVLGLLSLSGVAAIVYNLVTWDSPLGVSAAALVLGECGAAAHHGVQPEQDHGKSAAGVEPWGAGSHCGEQCPGGF